MPYTPPPIAQLTLETERVITIPDHGDKGSHVARLNLTLDKPPCSRGRPLLGSRATTATTCAAKKVVRFKDELESVRLFRQQDHPRAVSQLPPDNRCLTLKGLTATPTDASSVFILSTDGGNSTLKCSASWTNPGSAVYLEEIRLLGDATSAVGVVNVKNLAFEKHVACRFTLDNWTTQSEVAAEYLKPIESAGMGERRDSFSFSIPISDYSHLGCNRLEFCIRYRVTGLEFWDNNNSNNFVVSFKVERQDASVRSPGTRTDSAGRRHQDTPRGKEGALEIVGSSNTRLHCPFAELVQIGALHRRYDLSGTLSTIHWPDNPKNRNRVLPIMRTGPSMGGTRAIHQEPRRSVIK